MTNDSKNFLYGAAILGHTVEGENYASDWWRWEQRPGRIAGGATSQTAADHWNRYKNDVKLASTIGLNSLLISIEWSRIEPKRGEFDSDALNHYEQVLKTLNKNGITPIVALQAVTLPAWFAEAGGWARKDAPDIFAAYARETIPVLSPYCSHWIPQHRILDSLRMGYLDGGWPPGRSSIVALSKLANPVIESASLVSEVIREVDADALIGVSIEAPDVSPFDEESPWDYRTAKWLNAFDSWGGYEDPDARFRLGDVIDPTEEVNTGQFWVITLPGRGWARFAPTAIRRGFVQPVDEEGLDVDFRYRQPDASRLHAVMQQLDTEDLPVLFVGGAHDFAEDNDRCTYLLDHLEAIDEFKNAGVKVMGYIHESFLDGFEWGRGYSTRRGLVHVDWDTLARTPNPSAYLLGDIARQGGITAGAVRKYCPGWQSKLEPAR